VIGPLATPSFPDAARLHIATALSADDETDEHVAANHRVSEEEAEANAARIVACVNGCAGINPEAVPELAEALRAMLELGDVARAEATARQALTAGLPATDLSPWLSETLVVIEAARAAIARATGQE